MMGGPGMGNLDALKTMGAGLKPPVGGEAPGMPGLPNFPGLGGPAGPSNPLLPGLGGGFNPFKKP